MRSRGSSTPVGGTNAQQLLNDGAQISTSACNLGIGAGEIPAVMEAAGEWSRRLESEADRATALSELVDKVELKPRGIELSINLPLSAEATHGTAAMLLMARFIARYVKRSWDPRKRRKGI